MVAHKQQKCLTVPEAGSFRCGRSCIHHSWGVLRLLFHRRGQQCGSICWYEMESQVPLMNQEIQSRCHRWCLTLEDLLLGSLMAPSCCILTRWKGRGISLTPLFIRAVIPFMRLHPPNLIASQGPHHLIHHPGRSYEFWGDAHVQSTADGDVTLEADWPHFRSQVWCFLVPHSSVASTSAPHLPVVSLLNPWNEESHSYWAVLWGPETT